MRLREPWLLYLDPTNREGGARKLRTAAFARMLEL